MNKIPTISVIMPVYNAERYLNESINSILNQTFKDFEFIMIDDGSTDGSLKILQSFVHKDSRCIVRNQENRGISATINFGIALAKADIICIMDNDDISLPIRFEKQIQYLDAHPECVAVGTNALIIDPEGLPIYTWVYEQTHKEIDNINLNGTLGSRICHPSVALRKSSVLRVGGYNLNFHLSMDYDLFLRLAEVGQLANLPDALHKYRQHLASAGHEKRNQQLTETLTILEETFIRRGINRNIDLLKKTVNDYSPPTCKAQHLKWGWWAFSDKNYKTSIKHGIKATFFRPFNLSSIKLLACVARACMLRK